MEKLESSFLSCRHILPSDDVAIAGFTPLNNTSGFLAGYLKHVALKDEAESKMRTYLVFDNATGELVAYFSLKASLVSSEMRRHFFSMQFDALPSIEIANFAINGTYKEAHPGLKGIGYYIFEHFIYPICLDAAEIIGVRLIHIFALPIPRLIENYTKYGFRRLDKKDRKSVV